MKQIFVLVPNLARAQLIRQLLEGAGVHAHLSDGALPALTELERSHVDAVICCEDAGDMTGEDFRNILRYEPATRLTPVFLLTSSAGKQHAEPPNFDIDPAVSTLELVRRVLEQVDIDPAEHLPCLASEGDLRGGMDEVGLAELLTWVSEMELNGHWVVDAGGTQGYMLMQAGNVTYAEFGEHGGHAALLEMLDQVSLDDGSLFRFCQSRLPDGVMPRNIEERTERALMEVTVDLDHRHAERAGSPH